MSLVAANLGNLLPPVPWPVLAAGPAIVFIAGIVRGFAGSGFPAISVAGLAPLVPPASVVPAIFVLEALASVSLLKSALAISSAERPAGRGGAQAAASGSSTVKVAP